MSATSKLPLPNAAEREQFELRILQARFIASIKRVENSGPFALRSDCPPRHVLFERDPEEPDDYKADDISAIWYGFKLGLQYAKEQEL